MSFRESGGPLETILRQDRRIVTIGLVVLTLLCWGYLFRDHSRMMAGHSSATSASAITSPGLVPWTLAGGVMVFLMWSIMMVGMMVPSVSPMVLLFAAVQRKRQQKNLPYVPTGVFLLGYLSIWTIFSLSATLAQWGLHALALLSPMMVTNSPLVAGLILILAGIFQWLPFKNACLQHCRSPQSFIATHWAEGTWAAYRMGIEHGIYCVGCCWLLMAVLFATGVMNLLWVGILTIVVLIEKNIPGPLAVWFPRLVGLLMIVWGALVLQS